jgi:class 3 adenylate cyclase
MIKPKDLSIRTRLQIMLLVACLASIVVVGLFSWIRARDILTKRIFSQLTSERASKAYQIEAYFTALSNQIETLCEDRMVVEAMRQFDAEFEKLHTQTITEEQTASLEGYYTKEFLPRLAKNIKGDPAYETYRPNSPEALYLQYHYIANNPEEVGKKAKLEKSASDASGYNAIHERYQELFHGLVTRLGYYDLFLIDPETGEIVYSVHKETDFATNLYTGPYRNSNLAEVVKRVRDDPDRGAIQIVDYQFYRPSYNAPAGFIAGSIYDGEKRIGVLAVQLPIDSINRVLTGGGNWEKNGLGKSGETYMVGSDLLLRSASRASIEDSKGYIQGLRDIKLRPDVINLIEQVGTPILLQPIDTEAAKEAVRGGAGTKLIDGYQGHDVLSSFSQLQIPGVTWAIISEMSIKEAYSEIRSLEFYLLLTCILLVCGVTIYSGFAAKSFMSPIERMLRRSRDPGAKEDEEETDSRNEMGELSRSFDSLARQVREKSEEISAKNAEIESLLLNMLPGPAAERRNRGEERIVESLQQVTIVAMTIGNLERSTERHGAERVVDALNEWSAALEEKSERMEIERVSCFGGAYIFGCGLGKRQIAHVRRSVDFAREALKTFTEINQKTDLGLTLKIGIQTGSATTAVIGRNMFHFEVWGEAMDGARALSLAASPDSILVGTEVCERVKDVFRFEQAVTGQPAAWALVDARNA